MTFVNHRVPVTVLKYAVREDSGSDRYKDRTRRYTYIPLLHTIFSNLGFGDRKDIAMS